MIRVHSFVWLFKLIWFIFFTVYFTFKIFNYFYTENYCDYLSDVVQENSIEDIQETRKCVNTLICEVWNVRISILNNWNQEKLKSFSCVRKIKPWVWNW